MKSCGECGLCCKLMGVTALDKAPGRWCRHFSRAGGCVVYDDRPADCRRFNCTWLLADSLGPEWKPSVAGFLMHSDRDGGRLIVECDPARPHDWRRQPYESVLRAWSARPGLELLIFAGTRGIRLSLGKDQPVRRVSEV